MGGRLPPHSMNGSSSNGNALSIVSTVHDLNTVDSRGGDMGVDGLTTTTTTTTTTATTITNRSHEDGRTSDNLGQDEDNDSVDCVPQSYGHSLQLQVADEVDNSLRLDGEEPPRSPYGVLTDADVLPIEAARARFLDLLLSNFIRSHVLSCADAPETMYNSPNGKDKQRKRKARDVQFEGDPKYVLPLAYVANLYETLVSEINVRIASLENVHEKTMGVALEAAGGLYRRLVKTYPKSGTTYSYKRREMASAVEARNRFPDLVSGEEKRVRFVVVQGLELVERPNLSFEDAEWFKRITGRHEAAICDRDYKFFSARHKYRRPTQRSMPNLPAFPNYEAGVSNALTPSQTIRPIIPHAMECQQDHKGHPLVHRQQLPNLSHQQGRVSHLADPIHTHNSSPSPSPPPPPHVPRGMHSTSSLHVGSRMMVMPAKYCDECGSPYLRETSKYCSECGTKRIILTAP